MNERDEGPAREPNPEAVRRIERHLLGEDVVNIRAAIEAMPFGYTVVPKPAIGVANAELDRVFGGEEGVSPIRFAQRTITPDVEGDARRIAGALKEMIGSAAGRPEVDVVVDAKVWLWGQPMEELTRKIAAAMADDYDGWAKGSEEYVARRLVERLLAAERGIPHGIDASDAAQGHADRTGR